MNYLRVNTSNTRTSLLKENGFDRSHFTPELYEVRNIVDAALEGHPEVIAANASIPPEEEYNEKLKNAGVVFSSISEPLEKFDGITLGADNFKGYYTEVPAFLKKDDSVYYSSLGSNGGSLDLLRAADEIPSKTLLEESISEDDPLQRNNLQKGKTDEHLVRVRTEKYDNECFSDYRGISVGESKKNLLKYPRKQDSNDRDSFKECWVGSVQVTSEDIKNNFLLAPDALSIKRKSSESNPFFKLDNILISKDGYYSLSFYIKLVPGEYSSGKSIDFPEISMIQEGLSTPERGWIINTEKTQIGNSKEFKVVNEWKSYSKIFYLPRGTYTLGIRVTATGFHTEDTLRIMGLKLEEGLPSNYDYRVSSPRSSEASSEDEEESFRDHALTFNWGLSEKDTWTITYLRYIPGLCEIPSDINSGTGFPVTWAGDSIGKYVFGYDGEEIHLSQEGGSIRDEHDKEFSPEFTPNTPELLNAINFYNSWERVLLSCFENEITLNVRNINGSKYKATFPLANSRNLEDKIENASFNLRLGVENPYNSQRKTNAYYSSLCYWPRKLSENEIEEVFNSFIRFEFDEKSEKRIIMFGDHLVESLNI